MNETNYCLIQLKLDILISPNKLYIRIFDDVCSIDIVFHWERDKKTFYGMLPPITFNYKFRGMFIPLMVKNPISKPISNEIIRKTREG